MAPIAPLTRDSSSMMMVLARWPAPMPPWSGSIVAPIQPCSAISRESSTSDGTGGLHLGYQRPHLALGELAYALPQILMILGCEDVFHAKPF